VYSSLMLIYLSQQVVNFPYVVHSKSEQSLRVEPAVWTNPAAADHVMIAAIGIFIHNYGMEL